MTPVPGVATTISEVTRNSTLTRSSWHRAPALLPRPLVDQDQHAVGPDRLRLREAPVDPFARLAEQLPPRAEDDREDHQMELVDEVVLQELLHEPEAPRYLDDPVGLLFQLRDLVDDVALDHLRVVPLRVRDRRGDDVLRHRVELVRELAFAVRPRPG